MGKKSWGQKLTKEQLQELLSEDPQSSSFVLKGVLIQPLENFDQTRQFFRVMTNSQHFDNAWTHCAILFTKANDENQKVLEIGRNQCGVYLQEYVSYPEDATTEIQGETTICKHKAVQFFQKQLQYHYDFVSRNCKQFVYDFLVQVGGHPQVAFGGFINNIEHGIAVVLK